MRQQTDRERLILMQEVEADTLVRQVENVMADKEKRKAMDSAQKKKCEIIAFVCEEAYFKDKARKCERRAGCRDKACGR